MASWRSYLDEDFRAVLEREAFEPLDVRADHAFEVSRLPMHHRDPFDRILVAQALVEDCTLLSIDENVRRYDVRVLGD